MSHDPISSIPAHERRTRQLTHQRSIDLVPHLNGGGVVLFNIAQIVTKGSWVQRCKMHPISLPKSNQRIPAGKSDSAFRAEDARPSGRQKCEQTLPLSITTSTIEGDSHCSS
jgi:hypothetical protein